MNTKGKYPKGYPEGAVVHWTSGHYGTHDLNTPSYVYFLIDHDGKVYQNFPLDEWGHHAGASKHNGRSSVSRYYVGIEITCAGKLDKNRKSWFGKTYPENETRTVPKKDNMAAGIYHKYTEAQEESLIELLHWLERNNPKVFMLRNVVGHDEAAVPTGRKNDPGGSLSMTMPELRTLLYKKIGIVYHE